MSMALSLWIGLMGGRIAVVAFAKDGANGRGRGAGFDFAFADLRPPRVVGHSENLDTGIACCAEISRMDCPLACYRVR